MCLALLAAAPALAGGTAAATTAAGVGAASLIPGVAATASTAAASMSALQIASLAASAIGTGASIYGQYQQGKAAEQTAKNNAKTAEYAAQDALARGDKDAIELQRKGAALKSSQRVSLAAKGLDLGYGTADDLQAQTDFFTQSDVATTRTNARKEAWSRRAQKSGFESEALSAQANTPLQMTGSLLGGASQVASRWYDWSR